jgi:hypothetical protein
MQIREVAAPATRDKDLLANALSVLQHSHPSATLTGFDRAHKAGRPATQNDYVVTPGYHHRIRLDTSIFITVLNLNSSLAEHNLCILLT